MSDIDLARAVASKFNIVSERINSTVYLTENQVG